MAKPSMWVECYESSRRTLASTLKDDADLLVVGAIAWSGGVLRVAFAFSRHEVLGAEATLALGCVVLLPWLFIASKGQPEAREDARHLVDRAGRTCR